MSTHDAERDPTLEPQEGGASPQPAPDPMDAEDAALDGLSVRTGIWVGRELGDQLRSAWNRLSGNAE